MDDSKKHMHEWEVHNADAALQEAALDEMFKPTIFVDEIREYPQGKWCHMWTDGNDIDLDDFAARIGLKASWSHTSQGGYVGRFYHYDLTPSKRAKAVRAGARQIRLKDYIKQFMKA
jgi:hypothetical protein